jgi:low affinity Fe/Cu permease
MSARPKRREGPLPARATSARRDEEPWSERISHAVTEAVGSTWAFLIAAGVVIGWAVSGPLFGFSDTWQLVINTATTIVTFLMVFLIQRAQNKDSKAVQLKLNELVAAVKGASNRLIDVESLSEKEIRILHQHYSRLAELAEAEADPSRSHSIDEAERRHAAKRSA